MALFLQLPEVQEGNGDYLDIYTTFINDCVQTYPDAKAIDDIELIVDGYDVVQGHFPDEERLRSDGPEHYTAVMLTGSAHDAHSDEPWITQTVALLKDIAEDPRKQHLTTIGICFGFQVLARALGAECKRSPFGWEIGVYDVELTDKGRQLVEMLPRESSTAQKDVLEKTESRQTMSIQQFHKDYVPAVPAGTELIGSSPKCPVQGFVRYRDDGRVQMLAYQGHPEFTAQIVDTMVSVREKKGVLGPDVVEEARKRSGRAEGGQGRGIIGWSVIRTLIA